MTSTHIQDLENISHIQRYIEQRKVMPVFKQLNFIATYHNTGLSFGSVVLPIIEGEENTLYLDYVPHDALFMVEIKSNINAHGLSGIMYYLFSTIHNFYVEIKNSDTNTRLMKKVIFTNQDVRNYRINNQAYVDRFEQLMG